VTMKYDYFITNGHTLVTMKYDYFITNGRVQLLICRMSQKKSFTICKIAPVPQKH